MWVPSAADRLIAGDAGVQLLDRVLQMPGTGRDRS
jgi:hypothetical protein